MARGSENLVRLGLYGVVGVTVWQVALTGGLGTRVQEAAQRLKADPQPSKNAAQPSQQPATTAPTAAPATDQVTRFRSLTGVDPSNRRDPWIRFYNEQFGSWPDDDLRNGVSAEEMRTYMYSAISHLRDMGELE